MAFLLAGERPETAAPTENPVVALWGWLIRARAAHHQRIALRSLLRFDEYRLDDLGISRQDVVDALSRRPGTPSDLSIRRALRATSSLCSD